MVGKILLLPGLNSPVCFPYAFSLTLITDGIGVHTGEFLDVPPTGKSIVGRFVAFDRIENNKLVSSEVFLDVAGILIQLGVLPPPKGF